jgi:hypothetical protein
MDTNVAAIDSKPAPLTDAMRRAVPIPAQKGEIASARVPKSDRELFERRPHRKLRLRRAFQG